MDLLQDMLAWVKKRRRTIRREDLISFLCGKAPPHRSSRTNSRLAMVAPSRANSPAETGSSVETDLQPFREAIALHGKGSVVAHGSNKLDMYPGTYGRPCWTESAVAYRLLEVLNVWAPIIANALSL